jgi:archaellum component FlaC
MDREDRILEALAELQVEQAKQGVRLDAYNEHLKEHMRRSDALENQVDELYKFKYIVAGVVTATSAILAFLLDLLRKTFS